MSKWDKLLARICSLSKDMRFEELRKVLAMRCRLQEAEAVITPFGKWVPCRLPFQSMNQLKKSMWKR